jgi:hypothetical protein
MAVFYRALLAVENQEPGMVPRLDGGLGDKLRREMIVEIAGFHSFIIL